MAAAAAVADDDLWGTPQRPGAQNDNTPNRQHLGERFELPMSPVGEARLRRRSRVASDSTLDPGLVQRTHKRCVAHDWPWPHPSIRVSALGYLLARGVRLWSAHTSRAAALSLTVATRLLADRFKN
jgi:hypothetical protein